MLVDVEMVRSVRPCLATTSGQAGGGEFSLWAIGVALGPAWKYFGHADPHVLVLQGSAPVFNPTLSASYLHRMEEQDPEAYQSEVLAQFRRGLSTLFDPDAVNAVVDTGVRERPYVLGIRYAGFADAAGGTGKDRFALGIAHQGGERWCWTCAGGGAALQSAWGDRRSRTLLPTRTVPSSTWNSCRS